MALLGLERSRRNQTRGLQPCRYLASSALCAGHTSWDRIAQSRRAGHGSPVLGAVMMIGNKKKIKQQQLCKTEATLF